MSPLLCHLRVTSHDIPQMEGLRSFNVLCKGITWVKKKLRLLFFRLQRARNQVTVICKPKNTQL